MKKNLLKITTLSLVTSTLLFSSGWRIPEQSATSVALSGAHVANAYGAYSAYANPANMSFSKDQRELEISLMSVNLHSITYTDNAIAPYNGKSEEENFIIPTLFASSKNHDGLRYGLSVSVPGGLSKRWTTPYQKAYAEEFTLKIVELNPVVSYLVNPKFSVAAGLRLVRSEGVVKNNGGGAKRDMEGSSIDYGYNLALAYKADANSNISATYRSNVNLNVDGTAKIYLLGNKLYDGGANVSVPLPAVFTLAYAHTFDKTTVELEFDRTYWSKYKNLDFGYDSALPHPALTAAYDDPKLRDWKDSDAYRIGISHQYNQKLELLAGFAIDNNPAPTQTVGFELPDSDSKLYSVGANYKLDDKSSLGFGYLLDIKEDRSVTNAGGVNGKFTGSKASLISLSYKTSF